ncbi:MAG: hypothetical protein ABIN89_13480 [Chitinophagaceae bacterium]
MNLKLNLIAGLAGAVALNILHETVRQFDADAPRIELIGEEALTKAVKSTGINPPTGESLYLATLAGDIISNGLYYSMIGAGKNKNLVANGVGYGIAAGIGAIVFTKPLGLNDAPVNRTNKTKVMTVAYYVFGALITAAIMKKYTR